ncbi:MFS transporter [Streptomyces sp. NPDC057702]|uniref:MFS transporter n=1 Tax=unclassified Streptomyces TaxID=2593676 RepID=UPI00369FF852
MTVSGVSAPTLGDGRHTGWNARLVGQVAVLVLVNCMLDTAVSAPLLVLDDMLDHFDTDQTAWLNASAMLAGAMWAPLLGKSADVYGRRRVLVAALGVACGGALVCFVAPTLWVFILGRLLQGAALAAVFLSVALIRDLCEPRIGMVVTGLVTSGSAIFGIAFHFVVPPLAAEFGFRSVFLLSAVFAAVSAAVVRGVMPLVGVTTPGRVDVVGALVLGGGLAAVLSYISLGSELGWLAVGPLALLAAGVAALARWFLVTSRVPEPVVDIRDLGRPLVLTLLVTVLCTGAYQSMLQLFGLIIDVSPDEGLGYGWDVPAAKGLLFGMPAIGAMLGGTLAGTLATRIGPARTLAIGVGVGMVGTFGMFLGVSRFAVAMGCALLLGLTAGALVTSGFNMAATLVTGERQGMVSSLVMTVIAIGSVVLNFVGAAVLNSTDLRVAGDTVNSATGVLGYVAIAAGAFVLAALPAVALVRTPRRLSATPTPGPQPARRPPAPH